MKRHFMKSLKALCTGVMTFCVASFCFTSCYDDSALNARLDEVEDELSSLDERVKAIEALKGQLTDLTARVDALYTLKFQVSDSNELQYSFDGGTTWTGTGIILAAECDCEPVPECDCVPVDPCSCPAVSLVDNGDSVTITVGDASFTIEKPEEISFEIRAGKVYFESEGVQNIAIKTSGVSDVTVMSFPKGWYAEIASDGSVEVTAPNFNDTLSEEYWDDATSSWVTPVASAAGEGYVKIHACGVDGKCMVGKLPVIVSAQPVSIKAYNDMAYFNAAGTWPAMFYYGASPKEAFETEVASLLEQLNSRGWADWQANGDGYDNLAAVEASIEDLLGAKIEAGKEYVVYAIVEDYNKTSYSMDDFIIAYYSRIEVSAVENEAERTPYNVTVTVDVAGADSYYAVAIPESYIESEADVEMYKENLVASLSPDSWSGPMGKLYTDSYTGSVLDIAEGTTASMAGLYAPDSKVYLLILPMDGRSWDEYTVGDVQTFEFKTSPLTAGGSVDATAVPVDKYTVEEFSYETRTYVTVEKIVNKNFQVAVEVNPSVATGWKEFYYKWLDAETWAMYGSDDELLVDYVLDSWGMTPSDVTFPYYAVESVDPETTMHFVGLFVDESGKYGKLAKAEVTTEKVEQVEIAWNDPVPTNLVDDNTVLKNGTTIEVDLANATDVAAGSYKYMWTEASSWSRPFEGMTDADVALALLAESESQYVYETVTAEELADGKLVISGHNFGSEYYLAILPYDAEGKPGNSAAIIEYSCSFILDNVITDEAAFVGAPVVDLDVPTVDNILPDNGYGDGAYSTWSWSSYAQSFSYYYEAGYGFTVQEGTEVAAVMVSAQNYPAFASADAKARAEGVWTKKYGSFYTVITTEDKEMSYQGFNQTPGKDAPDVYLAISWKDADGNIYYKEYALQSYFQECAAAMDAYLASPDGKQLTFVWTDMGDAPACLDCGVTTPGQLAVAYDAAAVYGEDGLPAEMIGKYMQYAAWEYEITPSESDITSGVITLKSYDMYGDLQTTSGTYTGWNGTSCVVNCEMLYLTDVTMTVATETIPLYIESAAGGAL